MRKFKSVVLGNPFIIYGFFVGGFFVGGYSTCVLALICAFDTFDGGRPVDGLTGWPFELTCFQYPFGYCSVAFGIDRITCPSGSTVGGICGGFVGSIKLGVGFGTL